MSSSSVNMGRCYHVPYCHFLDNIRLTKVNSNLKVIISILWCKVLCN